MDKLRLASLRDWRKTLIPIAPLSFIGGLVGDELRDFDLYMNHVKTNPDSIKTVLVLCERIRRAVRNMPDYPMHLPEDEEAQANFARAEQGRKKKKAAVFPSANKAMVEKQSRLKGIVKAKKAKKAKKGEVGKQKEAGSTSPPINSHIFFDDDSN